MLQVIIVIIRPFHSLSRSFFFFLNFRQKIKGCLDYRHLWSMENVKPIYSTADTCIAGIKNTSNILFC